MCVVKIRHRAKHQFKTKTKARTKTSTEMIQGKTTSKSQVKTRAH